MLRSRNLLGVVIAASLGVFSFAGNGNREDREVLLSLKNSASVAETIKGIGVAVDADKDSKMIVVELSGNIGVSDALARLSKKANVRVALPLSARSVNVQSLSSVDNHCKYLEVVDDASDPMETHKDANGHRIRSEKADFYDALRYYLQRHVVVDSDYVDYGAIRAAVKQKSLMPRASISAMHNAPASTSGSWSFLGPKNLNIPYNEYYGTPPISGRISCTAFDPTTSSTIYAGSGGGGLWKSTDSGATWNCISDTSPWIYPAVDAISIDPSNPSTIYVGTGDFDGFFPGYNQGVMKSTDGGATWTNLGAGTSGISNVDVSRIMVDPDNDQIVTITTGRGGYGGPHYNGGNVWRSTDGGTLWTSAGLTASNYCALDVSIKDNNGNRTYWALGTGQPGLIYKSTNQGQTWSSVTAPSSAGEVGWTLACSKVSATTVYLLDTGDQQIFKTTNSGASWTNITNNLPSGSGYNWSQATYDYVLGTVPAPNAAAGEMLFCGLITASYSLNGGATWVDYGNAFYSAGDTAVVHSDQHQFAYSASNPSEIALGCDGGLFNLNITAWNSGIPTIALHPLNADLGITQFYQISPHPTDATQLLGGAQDNSSPCAITGQGNFTNWTNLWAGDGGWVGWNLARSELLTTADQGACFVYNLAGTSFKEVDAGEFTGFIAPTVFSADGSKLYCGGQTLQSCDLTQSSLSFASGNTNLTNGGYINYIMPVAADKNTIYTGSSDDQVWMTSNAGTSWRSLTSGSHNLVIGAIAYNQINQNDIIVGLENTGVSHVWHCANVKATTPVFTNASGSGAGALPDVPVNALVRDPYSPTLVWYAGTDIGVFMTINGGTSWSNVSSGLPIVQVYDLKYANGSLYAGTYGRGAWKIAFPAPATITSVVANPASISSGSNGSVTVNLSNAPGGGGVYVPIVTTGSGSFPVYIAYVAPTATSVTQTIALSGVTTPQTVTVKAALGPSSRSATITITSTPVLTGLTLSSSTEPGNLSATGTVDFGGTVPTGGLSVALASNNANAQVPPTVTIAANAHTANFTITTSAVTSNAVATISATYNSVTENATLTVTPATIASVLAPSVVGGATATVTVNLAGVTTASNTSVTITGTGPLTVPSSVTIAAGHNSGSFTVATSAVSANVTETIKAQLGSSTLTGTLTVTTALITKVAFSPTTIAGGTSTTCTITLGSATGPTGDVVTLTSTGPWTPPATFKVPAGQTSGSFSITASQVFRISTATLTATLGSSSQTGSILISRG